MPRFVILEHICHDRSHWDLMLQSGSILATWQVPLPPTNWPDTDVICTLLPPHRPAYLDYQGPVSNDRGQVRRCAAGDYQLLNKQKKTWLVQLTGGTISGRLQLKQISHDQWKLLFQGECSCYDLPASDS